MSNFKEELRGVKAFVFDIDGVLSHQTMYLHPHGEPMRTINIKDGYAMQLAVKKGYPVGVISGGATRAIKMRLKRLGVKDIYLGISNKKEALDDFLSRHGLTYDSILYMGDDLPDLEVMKLVRFPTCPADAVTEIKQASKYISQYTGGDGCVRDVMEQVMRLHNHWSDGSTFYW